MLDLINDLSEDELVQSRALAQLMTADSLATLLRLAAWFMADSQVANWEFEVEEGTQNVIRATWVIPKARDVYMLSSRGDYDILKAANLKELEKLLSSLEGLGDD